MKRLPSILAQILASTALVACGGKTADVTSGEPTEPASTSTSSSSSSSSSGGSSSGTAPPPPTQTPPPPTPPPQDAGCTSPPVLVRSGQGCADVFHQPCGYPSTVDPQDGFDQAECARLCGPGPDPTINYWSCSEYLLDDLPGPSVDCYTCVEGRRPQGYVERALEQTVAGWLAHAADLERVSIDAFQILARELTHHGAPDPLIEAARTAETDEVRHARVLEALAEREGAALSSVPVVHGPVRALFDIALENGVEGCIRETYGALVAGFQAEHARRLDIRRVMKRVYADEVTHAELAWDVHAWIMARLTPSERARVEDAMANAVRQLADAARIPTSAALIADLGLPPPALACELAAGLASQVFAPSRAA